MIIYTNPYVSFKVLRRIFVILSTILIINSGKIQAQCPGSLGTWNGGDIYPSTSWQVIGSPNYVYAGDFYRVFGNPGEQITISFCAGGANPNGWDTEITILDEFGNPYAFNNVFCGFGSEVTFTYGYGATFYYVLITEYNCNGIANLPAIMAYTKTNSPCVTGGFNAGLISPTYTTQTASMTAGQYFNFNATANDTILFSFCSLGGNATFDTEIRILDNLGNDLVPAFGDDDGCGVPYGSSELTFIAPYSGTFRVFTTQYPCASNSIPATLSYTLLNQAPPVIYSLSSQYSGWFIEGVNDQWNTFSALTYPVGTDSVQFYLIDSNYFSIQLITDFAAPWSSTFDMVNAQPNSTAAAFFYNNVGGLLGSTTLYPLQVIGLPEWIYGGGSGTVTTQNATTMTINCTLPIVASSTNTVPAGTKIIGNQTLSINQPGIKYTATFNRSTRNSAISGKQLTASLDVLSVNTNLSQPIGATITHDTNFELQAVSFVDSIDVVNLQYDFPQANFPLFPPFSVGITGSLNINGQLLGRVEYGYQSGQWGFIQSGTNVSKALAKVKFTGNLRGNLDILGGFAASVVGNITPTLTLGGGFDYMNVPSIVSNDYLGGKIRLDGNIAIKTLGGFVTLYADTGCLYGCSGTQGEFGTPIPQLISVSEGFFTDFGGSQVTRGGPDEYILPGEFPQPAFDSRNNQITSAWIEHVGGNDNLLMSTLQQGTNVFGPTVVIKDVPKGISDPDIGILPNNDIAIVWTQSRLTASQINDTIGYDINEIIGAQDVWIAYYDESSGVITHNDLISDDPSSLFAEGSASIAMGPGTSGIITWEAGDINLNSNEIWFSKIEQIGLSTILSSPAPLAVLGGSNRKVKVSYFNPTQAIALWINDPDNNEYTLNSNVMQSVWDGTNWTIPTVQVSNNGNYNIKDVALDFNDSYCVEALISSNYTDSSNVMEQLQLWVFNGDTVAYHQAYLQDSTAYFQKPIVSINNSNIASVTFQELPLYDDIDNPDQGTIQMLVKNISNTSDWNPIFSNPLLGNGSNNFVYDMDAGFGDGNNFYTLEHETNPNTGDVTILYPNNVSAKFCGDQSISLILRGVTVNPGLTSISPLSFAPPVGLEHYEDNNLMTTGFELMQNYPNPFSNSTTIEFRLPEKCDSRMEIFDMYGRSIAVLFDQEFDNGIFKTDFNSGTLPAGFYYYRLTVNNNKSLTKKMMIVK